MSARLKRAQDNSSPVSAYAAHAVVGGHRERSARGLLRQRPGVARTLGALVKNALVCVCFFLHTTRNSIICGGFTFRSSVFADLGIVVGHPFDTVKVRRRALPRLRIAGVYMRVPGLQAHILVVAENTGEMA